VTNHEKVTLHFPVRTDSNGVYVGTTCIAVFNSVKVESLEAGYVVNYNGKLYANHNAATHDALLDFRRRLLSAAVNMRDDLDPDAPEPSIEDDHEWIALGGAGGPF
jgi:hypothetical protein